MRVLLLPVDCKVWKSLHRIENKMETRGSQWYTGFEVNLVVAGKELRPGEDCEDVSMPMRQLLILMKIFSA